MPVDDQLLHDQPALDHVRLADAIGRIEAAPPTVRSDVDAQPTFSMARALTAPAVPAPDLDGRRNVVRASLALAGIAALVIVPVALRGNGGGASGRGGAVPHGSNAPAGAMQMSMDNGPEMQGVLDRTPTSRLQVTRTSFAAAGPQQVSFRILGADGAPVTKYGIEATKPLHLVIVRSDLSNFQHLHPTLGRDGTWRVRANFPMAGTYRMYADFAPAGQGRRVLGQALTVGHSSAKAPLPDVTNMLTAGGDMVHLPTTAFTVGRPGTLTVRVLGADGEPITKLQPYLGMQGHAVLIDGKTLQYQHTHPTSKTTGPDIDFMVDLPTAGRYRAFVQYRHGGRLHTVAFTITATSAKGAKAANAGAHGMGDMKM